MAINIDTNRPDEVEEVWFGDDGPYEFTIPKTAPLLAALRSMRNMTPEEQGFTSVEAQDTWLEKGFGPDQWARIQARIADEKDPLDYEHLMQVFDALFEEATDRPPTSLGGSSVNSPQDHLGARRKQAG